MAHALWLEHARTCSLACEAVSIFLARVVYTLIFDKLVIMSSAIYAGVYQSD